MCDTRRMAALGALFAWLCLCFCLPTAAQTGDEAKIERYSAKAAQALAARDLEGAAAALEALAQLTPDVPEVHANLGMVYYTQGRFDPAAKAFERALKLNRSMPNAEPMLGVCLAELGRYHEAIPILETAFLHPLDKQLGRLAGMELQRAYTDLRQYGKADAVSDELLSRYPSDAEILYLASRLHADRALQAMTRLVNIAPDSVWVHLSFAEVDESRKQYDWAISEYQTALRMEPRLPGVHFRLGRAIQLNSNDPKAQADAMREFEKELAIDPQNSSAEYEIGEIYRKQGQMEEARDRFLRAIQGRPDFEDAQIALARTLIRLDKPREALPHLLTAVSVNSDNEVSHFQLANVYKALGETANYQKEMNTFQKLHAVGRRTGLRFDPSLLGAPERTKQTLDVELPPKS